MNTRRVSRRAVITGCAALIPAYGFPARRAEAADLVCLKPGSRDASFRASEHYTEMSTAPDKNCAGCSFFRAAQATGCGRCLVFDGPANPAGHCDSWSKK